MTFNDIRKLHSMGTYHPAHIEVPQGVSANHIFDENQTVKWNREKARATNEAREAALAEARTAEGTALRRFELHVISAIQDEYGFSEPQAILVYNRAYETGHSEGLTMVLQDAEELADFIQTFENS